MPEAKQPTRVYLIVHDMGYDGTEVTGVFSQEGPAYKYAKLSGENYDVVPMIIDKGIHLADRTQRAYSVRFNKAGEVTSAKECPITQLREDFEDREGNFCMTVVASDLTAAVVKSRTLRKGD